MILWNFTTLLPLDALTFYLILYQWLQSVPLILFSLSMAWQNTTLVKSNFHLLWIHLLLVFLLPPTS